MTMTQGRGLMLLSLAAWLLAASAADAASPRAAVRAWRIAHERQIVEDFSRFTAMPDVATTLADVEANAAYISRQLEARGFRVRLLRAAPGTPPSVFAERETPGARRTVVFYAHYDGQPVNQKGWLTPPFQPTMRTAPPESKLVDVAGWKGGLDPDWRLYARAAADDKVTIQAMISALDALKAAGIKPTVNIKLLYEGEEEQGSPHFSSIVAQNVDALRGDLLIMGDGPMHPSGRQEINGGNRGITDFSAVVYGPTKPLHDGHYGSWAPSPAVMIADLVMSLRDDEGHILIPGIYDDVAPVSAADAGLLAALPPVEGDLKTALGLGRTIGPARLADGYLAPTLNIRAIHAGDEGPNAANAIATEATASVDIRLVPGETPARVQALTEAYLTAKGWFIVRDTPDAATRLAHGKILRLNWDAGASIATETPLDTPAAVAVAASIGRTVGYGVIKLPIMGGSSGFADIVNQLRAPMVGVAIANYDDNQHARNENLRLGNLWDGIEVYAGLLADLDW
jgi:acetylornithine deacetylase/succinyl-diaminopimelate desuccinylase-like protein